LEGDKKIDLILDLTWLLRERCVLKNIFVRCAAIEFEVTIQMLREGRRLFLPIVYSEMQPKLRVVRASRKVRM